MKDVLNKFSELYLDRVRLNEQRSILKSKQQALSWRDSETYNKLLVEELNLNSELSENLASIIKLAEGRDY